jgi:MFS family permease
MHWTASTCSRSAFASPGIYKEWGINNAALGIVLSMELIGMAVGSVFLGGVADRIGRRPTILGCLVAMAIGMVMATTARGLVDLSIWRVVTGLGIGGMLASINAVAAEFSNARRRALSVSLMSIGYPLGAVVGGLVVAQLLRVNSDWRPIFYFGSSVTALLIPIVYFVIQSRCTGWPASSRLARLKNQRRLATHGTCDSERAAEIPAAARTRSIAEIFQPGLVAITTIVTLAYFFHITTFYFIVKWIPKIVVDMGFAQSSAAGVLVWTNVGGATGGAVFGLLTLRFGLKPLTIVILVLSTVMVTLFGRSPADLDRLSQICAMAGFCTNAASLAFTRSSRRCSHTGPRVWHRISRSASDAAAQVLAPIIAGLPVHLRDTRCQTSR